MTPPVPPSNGDHQRQPNDASKRDIAKKLPLNCKICHRSSHTDAQCPFLMFLNLRHGPMTFERQVNIYDQPRFSTSSPRPGDSPVYRAPVPLAPRALRHVNSSLPLLIPPRTTSTHVVPSHVSKPDNHSTDSTGGAHSTTVIGTESTKEVEISKGENGGNEPEKCDG